MDDESKSNKKYILNLDVLKPGDIILEHGYKAHSLAIMKATGSHYSHAMLYEGSTIIEATSKGGVFSKVPNRFAVVNENDLKVLRLIDEPTPSQISIITTTSRALTGSQYNTSEAIKAGKKKKPQSKHVKGQFCSRLVAQCYKKGGINIVSNINYCSPADIEKSTLLSEVNNAVKEASEAELAHALAPSIHTEHLTSTVQWVKAAKKILKKSDVEAETINDIYTSTVRLKNPKVDKLILKEIQASGYYSFYLEDKNVNPYRYDIVKFSEKTGEDLDVIDAEIYKEISIIQVQSENLKSFRNLHKLYPSCLIKAEIELYLNILDITSHRLEIILEHCKNNNLAPKLLTDAQKMVDFIEQLE